MGGRPPGGVARGWTVAALGGGRRRRNPRPRRPVLAPQPRGEVWRHLWRTQLLELCANTFALLVGVGAGTLVVGTLLAWLVVHYRFPGRDVFEWALILPLAVPAYVIGFAFLGLFEFSGPVQTALRGAFGAGVRLPELRSWGGVTLMMTLVFYPYVYLLARSAFREQGSATLETARSLGRSRARAFVEVTLPLARPSLAAGVALAMMEALGDFGTVATFGYRTLTEGLYRVWYGMFDRTAASQLAALLLLFARGPAQDRASVARPPAVQPAPPPRAGGRAHRPPRRARRRRLRHCGVVLGLAFLLPVGQLAVWAAQAVTARQVVATFGALLGQHPRARRHRRPRRPASSR